MIKKLSKALICGAVMIFSCTAAYAQPPQETTLLGIGVQGLAPMGSWSDSYYIGVGAGILGEFFLSEGFSLNPEYFFKSYPGRDIEVDGETRRTTALPYHNISLGAKMYLLPILYVGIGAGCFYNGDTDNGRLGITPAAGVKLDRLDGQIHATFAGDYKYVGIRFSFYFLGW